MDNKEFAYFMAMIGAGAVGLVSAYYLVGTLIVLLS